MNKFTRLAPALGLLFILVPAAALAKGDGNDRDGGHGIRGFFNLGGKIHWDFKNRFHTGTVTAVGTSSFDIKTSDGTILTVNTGTAKLQHPFGATIQLSDIKVNDKVQVKGTTNGNQIDAAIVVDSPENTHPAKAHGTVTAVNGNSFTLQSNHQGVVFTVNVNTNSTTTFKSSSTSTTTIANVQVGSKVTVKGLWDEILNILNAIKVHIR
jgi:hypothetical protein